MATQDDYIRTALRVPPDLHAQIHGAAKENNRTFNAEIVARLQASLEATPSIKLKGSDKVLLRALADFVVLRHNHPEVMASMEDSMVKMARAIKEADDGTNLLEAAGPWLKEYVVGLADSVNKVTELLGPGWGNELTSGKPAPEKPKE